MPKPTAEDVISLLEQLIKLLGPDTLAYTDWTQFYSGPQDKILARLFGHTAKKLTAAKKNKSNHKRAARQAARFSATLIEDTKPGQLLNIVNVFKFFNTAYFPDVIRGRIEADKVNRFLSREFARAAKGHVITAVCGADRDKIFRDVELPELVTNPNIETVNGIPAATIKKLYFSSPATPEIGHYRAFRLICLSELRISVRRAWNEASREVISDLFERRAFYDLDRRDSLQSAGVTKLPKRYTISHRERYSRRTVLKTRILSKRPAIGTRHAPAKTTGVHL